MEVHHANTRPKADLYSTSSLLFEIHGFDTVIRSKWFPECLEPK